MIAHAPRIWLVLGDKLGDNAQLSMIVDSLGLAYETRRLRPKQAYTLGKPKFRVSIDHFDMQHSDSLAPPWPDLVITAGRRHAMAALWIKAQHPATRIVLLGRPRRWIERFDLIIGLPQYRLPPRENVLSLDFPLMRSDKAAVASASSAWRKHFEALKKPIIAVLVGGPTRPYRFDASATEGLIAQCIQLQEKYGGTLYFTTSRRTPKAVSDLLAANRPPGALLYRWQDGDTQNPYLALLGLADYFVVTGDSVSMMVEVADRGKPLVIFPLPSDLHGRLWRKLLHRLHRHDPTSRRQGQYTWLGEKLYQKGIIGFPRNLNAFHRQLVDKGFAVYAGQAFTKPTQTLPTELEKIGDRIISLMDSRALHISKPTDA